jgi:hypothetical protein
VVERRLRDCGQHVGTKRLTYRDIQIRAVHEGVVNTILVGLRGLVGQLYREDGAEKVRRGMTGRVRSGLSGGGITYGYAEVQGETGKRVIVEAEAEIVRRIFDEYVAGRTPRAIAHDLSRDKIAPPRGRQWNASTINGSSQRGNGLIRCELYVGRLVWNKVRMIKNPDTGKRVSRPNPPKEWQIVDVPDLAIVTRGLFDAAQNRKAKNKGTHCSRQQAPKRILSGSLRCAACGGGMSSKAADKTGRVRVRCTTAHESGTCPDPQTFYIDLVESRVLAALRAEMQSPAAVAEYVKAYVEERAKLAAKLDRERVSMERRLGEAKRTRDRLIDDIVAGHLDAVTFGPKATELDRECKRLEADLQAIPPQPIALHPGVLADYGRKLERLQAAIEQGTSEGNTEYGQAIRDLVECVTVRRDDSRPDGFRIEVIGRLNALLGEKAFPNVGGLGGSGGPLQLSRPTENIMFFRRSA